MASAWNLFVKKIYHEGVAKKGKSYSFKQALKDASARKGEMGSSASSKSSSKKSSSSKRKSRKRRSKSKKRT